MCCEPFFLREKGHENWKGEKIAGCQIASGFSVITWMLLVSAEWHNMNLLRNAFACQLKN